MQLRERLEWVEGWGMAVGGAGYVFRPTEPGGVAEALSTAREHGLPIALRGSGCSYGDAALRPESVVLDLSELSRIVLGSRNRNMDSNQVSAWQLCGEWSSVTAGGPRWSRAPWSPVGGMLAMNVHGKNNWAGALSANTASSSTW